MPQADSELQSLLSQRSHGSLHLLGDLRYWRPCLGMLPQQFNVRCGVGLSYGSLVRFGHFLLLERRCLHTMLGQIIKRIIGITSRSAATRDIRRHLASCVWYLRCCRKCRNLKLVISALGAKQALDRYSGRSGDFVLVLRCCHAAVLSPTAWTSASRSSTTRW